jgi:hypothetical protein
VGGVVKNEAQALLTDVHGNAGRVPSNAMPPEQIKLIERAIEASTVTNPVKNVLNVTKAGELVGGYATLANAILASIPDNMVKRATITIIRFVKKYCRDRGLRGLSVHTPENNACPLCATDNSNMAKMARKVVLLEHDLEDAQKVATAGATSTGTATSPQQEHEGTAHVEVERLLADLTKAQEEFMEASSVGKEHYGLHQDITRDVKKLQGLFQALEAESATNGSASSECMPRSKSTVMANVFDDKTAQEIPTSHTTGTEVTSKFTLAVNCQGDMVTEGATLYSLDQSTLHKTTNIEINQVFLNCLCNNRGQRVLFLLSDMGPLLYTAAINMLCISFLTDMGFYDMVICAYLQRYHSKQLCDRM